MKPNSYYRARLRFIEKTLDELPKDPSKNGERRLLRYGVIRKEAVISQDIQAIALQEKLPNTELAFLEKTRYNNWFAMHPEKVCGIEVITSSHEFPLGIRGTKEDIIKTIRQAISTPINTPVMTKAKAKARALQIKLRLHDTSDWYQSFQGLDGLDALEELGELGDLVTKNIAGNLTVVEQILQDERKYAPTDSLSFEEVVKLYNQGITEDEIRAWVWYQKGKGEKMLGWEKYHPKTSNELKTVVSVKSLGDLKEGKAVVKDNHFRDLVELAPGTMIGTATRKKHEHGKEYYQIVKTDGTGSNGLPPNALVYVKENDIDLNTQHASIQNGLLDGYVKNGVLFYLNGQLLPYPVYAYGNMYDRELQLNADKAYILANYGKEVCERQHSLVMQSVDKGGLRPKILSILNPDITQRPKILAISQFAKDFMVTTLKDETALELEKPLSLFEAFKRWLLSLDKQQFKNINPQHLIKYYLDGDNLSKYLSEEEKSSIEKYGMLEAEELFVKFLYEALTFEDQQKIDFSWNRTFNGHSAIPYNKVPIGFACSAMFKSGVLRFSQAQREAIAFMEIAKSGVIAYDVGVGKTMSAIITLANNLYSGKCLRPLIVVPNPTYAKWVREIIGYTDQKTKQFVPGVLSNVGYKVNEWYNLGTDISRRIDFGKKIEAKTITVLTYEGFAKIGFGRDVFQALFTELAFILNQQDVAGLTQRDIEKRNQKYREMLGQGNKGTVADIDVLGIDYMVIDEAHNFKNVFDNVMAGKDGVKRFKITGSQSTRAVKAFFLCNYVQRMFGRNVMLLTATPFTNSPLEIYSMLSLVAYHYMKANGLGNVQRFMEAFVLQTLEYVNSYDDTIREQHVVKSFNNRIILQQLIFNHIAYKTGEDAGVKRPCKINLPLLYSKETDGALRKLERDKQILTYLEMTPSQRANQEEIVSLARSATAGDGNIMRALAQSLDNAVSPFLYKHSMPPADYKEFVDESPKIKYVVECIRSVKRYHEERKEPVSGQVMYINRGKEFFRYIKEYLEKEVGYKTRVKFNRDTLDEVEVITSGMTLERKETIKDAFLEGVCKIIIGTSTIREGIDLQRKGSVLYNCYPDWNPTDVKQLEGRIWRQGNEFGYVRVVMPLVQDSMDVFVFQKLEEKTSRINDLWYRGGSANVIDLDSMDPEEVKFALFTNIEAIASILIDKERREIFRRTSIIENHIDTLLRFDVKLRLYFEYQAKCRERLQSLANDFRNYFFRTEKKYEQHPWFQSKTKENQKNFLERVDRILQETSVFLASALQEDKELLRLGRVFHQLAEEAGSKDGRQDVFGGFKSFMSEVRKAEETILKQKGFTIHDDLPKIIATYRADLEKVKLEMENLRSQAYMEKVYHEVKEKKERLAVRGESPEERAKSFAELNYLLSYASGSVAANCLLPTVAQPKSNKIKNIKLLKLKAKSLKIRLVLNSF